MKEHPKHKDINYRVESRIASTPSSPIHTMTSQDLPDDQRFRSESEPIMSTSSSFKNSNTSIASSLEGNRDSVISNSSMSSEQSNDGSPGLNSHSLRGLVITRTSSTRSAPSDTLMRGSHLSHDSDGYCEGDDPDEGPQDEEVEEGAEEADDEFPESPSRKKFGQVSTIIRKTAIRRVHTVTPQASPKLTHRRSRINSRSKVGEDKFLQQASSSENFTVTVDLPTCKELVCIPAKQGISLGDAIGEIEELRKIDLSSISIFVESSISPTPLNSDCSFFAGRQLYLRAKGFRPGLLNDRTRSVSTSVVPQIHVGLDNGLDSLPRGGGRKDLSKFLGVEPAASKTSRTRRSSVPNIVAPPIAKPPSKAKEKPTPQMDPKLKVLQEKLDDYMVRGLPDFPSLMFFAYPPREDDAELLTLEENWRLVVDDHANLPKSTIDQQEAIWEIVHTEVGYIKNIRVIIDIYMTCLIDLQAAGILNSTPTEKIFSNITDIECRHSKFWKEKLINVMKVARETRQPLSAAEVAKAFEGFADHFQPYVKFCTEEESCMEFLREKEKDDEQLKLFLQWCQDYKDSRRLKLGDLLVYPMQRITKYPLLLKAIGKKSMDGDKEAVNKQMANVEAFIGRINHEVRREQETKKMTKMIQRIEVYDWPEIPSGGTGSEEVTKLIQECPIMMDLNYPMKGACQSQPRWVVYEGSVKIRDQYGPRFDATIVIFTDMLTICKKGRGAEPNNLRIVRPPIRIDRVKTAELKDNSGFAMLCTNEFNCATNYYIVSTQSTTVWLDKINKAIEMYENACSNKDLDKFLDMSHTTNTGLAHLQLPEFLRERSPRSSPQNSPRMPRQFSPSLTPNGTLRKTNSASGLCKLQEEDEQLCKEDEIHKKVGVSLEEDSFEKESLENGGSSMEESPDADTEGSESGDEPTPTLTRPSDIFPNDRRESLKNETDFSPSRHNTLTPDDIASDMSIFQGFAPSPTSPPAAAIAIMAFDDDFDEEENPANPTPFSSLDGNNAPPKRTMKGKANQLKMNIGGNLSKAMSRGRENRGRKPIPNGVVKTQVQDILPNSSGEESAGDSESKSKKKPKGGFFSKKNKGSKS